MKRVPPSVRLKEEINGLLQGAEPIVAQAEPPMVGFVGRLARYMLQVAIEAEATAFLGREHYRRGARQRVGWRNGYSSADAISSPSSRTAIQPRSSAWNAIWTSASPICSFPRRTICGSGRRIASSD